ncbi:hypothetical protein [Phormidium sp. FACHB-592]|nr:hypothetical protein [Phormidium sp. FACHB-592]
MIEASGRVLTETEAILLYQAEAFPEAQVGASPASETR